MKKKIVLLGALIASTALSGQAFAALSNAANLSSANVKPSAWEKFKEKSSVSYFAEFDDKTALDPDTKNGTDTANQNFFYQAVSGRYQVNDTWTARADIRMQTQEGAKDKYQELNPRLGIQGVVFAKGNFSIFNLSRVELGMVDSSRKADQIIKPKVYNAANYTLGAHSFSTGLELSKWIYDDTPQKEQMQFGVFMDVTYRYTFNDFATFQTYVELPGSSRLNKGLGDLARQQQYERFLVGMSMNVAKNFMNIAKNVNIFPYIDYQPYNDKRLGDLGIGAWISAGFFQ